MNCTVRTCAGVVVAGMLAVAVATVAIAQGTTHKIVNANELKWGPAPPGLPAGGQVAVLEGDPAKAGEPFALRIKIPDGYKVAPHWHPTDENIIVLSGTLMMGLGDKFDSAKMHPMTAGSYGKMPRKTNHYVTSKGETIFHLHGVGPFEITYVNPNDDPRKKTSTQ